MAQNTTIIDSSVVHAKEKYNVIYVFGISIVAAMGGLMFGFDLGIITGVIPFIKNQFHLENFSLGWVVAIFEFGCMAGSLIIAGFADKYGRKKVMIFNSFFLIVTSCGAALSPNAYWLSFWRLMQGFSVGAASVLSPMYIAEVSPAQSRGKFVSINQLTIILGILLATIAGWTFGDKLNPESWRWMLGSALVPSSLFFILLFLIPETPRWLVKANKNDKAKKVLERIGISSHFEEIKKSFDSQSHKGSYKELFGPILLPAFVVGLGIAVLQQFCGINNVTTYIQEIFSIAKMELEDGLFKGIFVGLIFFFFTFIAIMTVDKLGRKKLMLIGTGFMSLFLFLMAWAFYNLNLNLNHPEIVKHYGILVFIFLLAYIATFAFTLGPVVWVLLSEIYPNYIREKAQSIASCVLWTATFLVILVTPYLLKWPVFNFSLFGVLNIVGFFFVLRYLPETKGKTLEEIESVWKKS